MLTVNRILFLPAFIYEKFNTIWEQVTLKVHLHQYRSVIDRLFLLLPFSPSQYCFFLVPECLIEESDKEPKFCTWEK